MVLLAILAKRLEILAVHAVLEPGLVDKDNHVALAGCSPNLPAGRAFVIVSLWLSGISSCSAGDGST